MSVAEHESPSLTEVAQHALNIAGGDVIRATKLMTEQVLAEPGLYRPLMDPLVRDACYQRITLLCRKQRRAIWHPPQPSTEIQREQIGALAKGVLATLLDFPLPGGLRLGEAYRDDVSAAAEFYRRQSKDMGEKSRWLLLIAQHLPAKKQVKAVLNHARLAELQTEACHD